MNPDGLRWPDEFVRHKMLDALGDLVTLGMPLMGHLVLYKAGHDVLNRLVRKIVESPDSYRHVELGADLPMNVASDWDVDQATRDVASLSDSELALRGVEPEPVFPGTGRPWNLR